MAGKNSVFIDNSAPAVDAGWLNIVQNENKNIVESSDQTLNDAVLDQEAKSIASYAGQCGVFAVDSGAADAYVLTQVSPFKAPFSLKNGLTIRFRPGNNNTGACTVNSFGLGVKDIKKADGSTNPSAGDISTTQDTLLRYDGTNFRIISNFVISQLPSGSIVQVQNFQTGSSATGTTLIPYDNTIPQNNEGDQFMSLSITPTNASNKLRIEITTFAESTVQSRITTALFQDSNANALIANSITDTSGIGGNPITLLYTMTAGTTSSTTFKVRIGADSAGTITFNGRVGAGIFGGVLISSINITEIKA